MRLFSFRIWFVLPLTIQISLHQPYLTIAEKVAQLMQPKIEQMVQEALHPHLQPSLDKQVILEETISQHQDGNTKLNAKIDLIHMRFEEQEQYFRRTSLRFLNVRVPTDQKGNIIQPVHTERVYEMQVVHLSGDRRAKKGFVNLCRTP